MIKNIVFDVGDVLIRFRYRDHMRDLGFSEDVIETLSRDMVLTEFWSLMDQGVKMEKDAVEHFSTLMPTLRREIEYFWQNTEGLVEEYPYSTPLIRKLKAEGYKVYLLSNYPKETAERHWPTFSFVPETDGYIISAFEKMIKPDPAFYRLLFTRFGLVPEECLFIDDREKNLVGAKEVGMETILFTGYEPLVQELEQRGILN